MGISAEERPGARSRAPHTEMRSEHREALQARTGGVRDGGCLWAHREYDAGGRSGNGGTYGSHEGGDGRQGGWFATTTCRAQGQVRGLLAHCGHQWARRRARRSSRVLSIQQPPSPVPEWNDVDRGRSWSRVRVAPRNMGVSSQGFDIDAHLHRTRRRPNPFHERQLASTTSRVSLCTSLFSTTTTPTPERIWPGYANGCPSNRRRRTFWPHYVSAILDPVSIEVHPDSHVLTSNHLRARAKLS